MVLANVHDFQNHVKRWCPEQPTMKHEALDDDEMPIKRPRFSTDFITENGQENDSDRENEVYDELVELSREHNEDEWQQKVDIYEKDALSASEAMEKANKKLRISTSLCIDTEHLYPMF